MAAEHPFRNLVSRCCDWHQSRYKWQAVVTPCSTTCVALLTSHRVRLDYAIVQDTLASYLRENKVEVSSLVVDKFATETAYNRVYGGFWVPAWIRPLFPLGSRMRSKWVPKPHVAWPRFLSRCNADEQLRCAVLAAYHVGADAPQIYELIAVAAPDLLEKWQGKDQRAPRTNVDEP